MDPNGICLEPKPEPIRERGEERDVRRKAERLDGPDSPGSIPYAGSYPMPRGVSFAACYNMKPFYGCVNLPQCSYGPVIFLVCCYSPISMDCRTTAVPEHIRRATDAPETIGF